MRAGSVLRGSYPEHAVIAGNPAQVVGDARDGDQRWLDAEPALRTHYQAWVRASGPSAGPLPSRPAIPSGDRPAYSTGEGQT